MYYKSLHENKPIHTHTSRHDRISLPAFVPVLQGGMPRETKLPSNRLYGVYLRTILDSYASFKYKTRKSLRCALRLPPSGRLALFLTGNDTLIERAWEFSKTRDLWKRIVELNFAFVTSATYSVYEDDPRSDQIYNQERNFRTHDIFCELGVPTIPFLFFNPSSTLDYDSIISWLRHRRDVRKVGVLGHCYRHWSAFNNLLKQIRSIVTDIGRPLEFVFVGVAAPDKIRQVVIEYPNACFVTAQPVMKGISGCRTILTVREECANEQKVTNADLIVANIKDFDRQIAFDRDRYHGVKPGYQYDLPFGPPAHAIMES